MSGIADFLRARIQERRALAEAASPGPWHADADGYEVLAVDGITVADGFALSDRQLRATVNHIAANDPADVIADCDAKLALVEMHPPEEIPEHSRRPWSTFTVQCASESWKVYSDAENRVEYPCRTLRLLAQPFAGHPDHKGEQWAP
ncbi:DUF6221 family protein [Streptomyces sp. NBC_00006]|uniref:DUF6221 family protein n=1 Tax=Streptomyces sp. NBC_00006 TaxID=2975619 RepID=UPI0022532254|nr:DUF6221 family protein [Streptomyces sp. NBC_00006]MCX5537838.1 DUF6221 family protein [Streptomyces sp. NBC_00006]